MLENELFKFDANYQSIKKLIVINRSDQLSTTNEEYLNISCLNENGIDKLVSKIQEEFKVELPIIYSEFHKIVLEQEDYFIEKQNYIKRSPLEKLILITPNPTIISNFRKLTINEKNKIKKYLKKYPKFFPDIYKIPIKKLNISCISSIYINKCHYDFLEEKIPTLNI